MKRIALVGAAASYKATPWQDRALEIWGLGRHRAKLARVDRLFEVHDAAWWPRYMGNHATYARSLADVGVPVVMRDVHPEIPLSERFPFEAVQDRFGPYAIDWDAGYYVSSAAYMIAAALLCAPAEIHVYGFHMVAPDEYQHQRPNMEFWLGVAVGMGVRVHMHPRSPLLRTVNAYGSPADLAAEFGVSRAA